MIDLLRAKEPDSMEPTFLPSHPLFSTIVALYILFLLYSPPAFLTLLLSPVLPLTVVLLLTLLRFGSAQEPDPNTTAAAEPQNTRAPARPVKETPFVGWDVKAPLEVIYEEYEGDRSGEPVPVPGEARFGGVGRWPSLSLCYPESDSDSGSEPSSPEEEFGWVDADGDGGMIEIQLDLYGGGKEKKRESFDFPGEEENLIEIDISPARSREFLAEKMVDWD